MKKFFTFILFLTISVVSFAQNSVYIDKTIDSNLGVEQNICVFKDFFGTIYQSQTICQMRHFDNDKMTYIATIYANDDKINVRICDNKIEINIDNDKVYKIEDTPKWSAKMNEMLTKFELIVNSYKFC